MRSDIFLNKTYLILENVEYFYSNKQPSKILRKYARINEIKNNHVVQCDELLLLEIYNTRLQRQ